MVLVFLLVLWAGGCSRAVDQAAGTSPDQQVDTSAVEASEQPASGASGGQEAGQRAGAAPAEDSQQQASGAPGGGNREREASGVPGLPGDRRDGAQAVGAPIKIPSFLDDEGRPLADVKAELEAALKQECGGGELCVTLRVEFSDANHTRCEFARTEPAQDTEVARGSTVVIVAGSQPCTPPSSAEPPDSTQPPPSSSEAPPSSSEQSPPSSSQADSPPSSS